MGPSANPSADGPAPADELGSGAGDARFERLGMRCGVTFAEPSDSGCVASSSLKQRFMYRFYVADRVFLFGGTLF